MIHYAVAALLATTAARDGGLGPRALAGLAAGWTRGTFVPVLTNAGGGLVVGLVTKYMDGVKKGFALIAGILVTSFTQTMYLDDFDVTARHHIAVVLVAVSTWLHTSFPSKHVPKKKDA